MFSVTRFCVQPFERRGGALELGEPQQFYSEGEAVAYAARALRRSAGALVVSVAGWPALNIWDRPCVVMKRGDVPGWAVDGLPTQRRLVAQESNVTPLRRRGSAG